jgi:hypothetical protein
MTGTESLLPALFIVIASLVGCGQESGQKLPALTSEVANSTALEESVAIRLQDDCAAISDADTAVEILVSCELTSFNPLFVWGRDVDGRVVQLHRLPVAAMVEVADGSERINVWFDSKSGWLKIEFEGRTPSLRLTKDGVQALCTLDFAAMLCKRV